jgi:hypothetical protein
LVIEVLFHNKELSTFPKQVQNAFPMTLDEFRAMYPPEPSRLEILADHRVQIDDLHGLRDIRDVHDKMSSVIAHLFNVDDAKIARYLWVYGVDTEVCAIEKCKFAEGFRDGVIKHSNLTGGGCARCAGEMWFLEDGSVIINGSSGRYGPKSSASLRHAGLVLTGFGYKVAIMGFKEGEVGPKSIIEREEDLEWLN